MASPRRPAMCVFSAHAEVVPFTRLDMPEYMSILRARGGSSALADFRDVLVAYSPRTRR